MSEDALRATIARNIGTYRRICGMTQAELAEKLNYSDKSVSKWERGEGIPDICVLARIGEIFGVSVSDLLREDPPVPEKTPSRVLVTLLSIGLVWLVAAIIFTGLELVKPSLRLSWMAFIFALPVSCIVLTVFTSLWWNRTIQCLSVSGLIWTLALSIYLMTSHRGIAYIFVVAAILQVLNILWFLLISKKGRALRK